MTVNRLQDFGMRQMSEGAIEDFLESQDTGVLGLPAPDGPYMVPLSFGYDGEKHLHFTYIGNGESRKMQLSDRAEMVRFLVYSVDSPFNWASVMLRGTIEKVPRPEWGEAEEAIVEHAWHPDLLEQVAEFEKVHIYRLTIEEWSGVRHTGLPAEFEHEPPA